MHLFVHDSGIDALTDVDKRYARFQTNQRQPMQPGRRHQFVRHPHHTLHQFDHQSGDTSLCQACYILS